MRLLKGKWNFFLGENSMVKKLICRLSILEMSFSGNSSWHAAKLCDSNESG